MRFNPGCCCNTIPYVTIPCSAAPCAPVNVRERLFLTLFNDAALFGSGGCPILDGKVIQLDYVPALGSPSFTDCCTPFGSLSAMWLGKLELTACPAPYWPPYTNNHWLCVHLQYIQCTYQMVGTPPGNYCRYQFELCVAVMPYPCILGGPVSGCPMLKANFGVGITDNPIYQPYGMALNPFLFNSIDTGLAWEDVALLRQAPFPVPPDPSCCAAGLPYATDRTYFLLTE